MKLLLILLLAVLSTTWATEISTTVMSPLHQQFLDVAERHAVLFTTKEPTTTTTTTTTTRPPTDPQPSYHSAIHKEFLAAAERHEAREIAKKSKMARVEYFAAPSGNVNNCRIEMFKFIHHHCQRACKDRTLEEAAVKRGCQDKGSINSEHVRFLCCGGPKPEGQN